MCDGACIALEVSALTRRSQNRVDLSPTMEEVRAGILRFAVIDTKEKNDTGKRTWSKNGVLATLRLALFTFHWVQGSPLPKEA